jgi:hypothetical protein
VRNGSGELDSDALAAYDEPRFLGLDRKTVYVAVRRRDIPHRRIGRKLLFRRALREWRASQGSSYRGRK